MLSNWRIYFYWYFQIISALYPTTEEALKIPYLQVCIPFSAQQIQNISYANMAQTIERTCFKWSYVMLAATDIKSLQLMYLSDVYKLVMNWMQIESMKLRNRRFKIILKNPS